MFALGLFAALLGNVVIGVGQVLQKMGLNRIQQRAMYTLPHPSKLNGTSSMRRSRSQPLSWFSKPTRTLSMADLPSSVGVSLSPPHSSSLLSGTGRSSRSTSPAAKRQYPNRERGRRSRWPGTRFTDAYWLAGVFLNLLGEICGNWAALSFLSPAAVAPLGGVAVIVNAALAQRWLNETVTETQRRGYALMAAGVASILFVAPRGGDGGETGASAVASTTAELSYYVTTLRFCGLFAFLLLAITGLCYTVLLIKESLLGYVAIASCFGSLTVMASKTISLFARLAYNADGVPLAPASNNTRLLSSPVGARHALAGIHTNGSVTAASQAASLPAPPSYAVFGLTTMLVISVVGQELSKQAALGQYPATAFQPLFYASYLSCVSLSGVFLFKELPDHGRGALLFAVFFIIGIALIFRGSLLLQHSGARQPKPIENVDDKIR